MLEHYNVDPVVVNGDQMPLHRNETSQKKTMNLKNQDCFVKEKAMLSRERATCFTQIASKNDVLIYPEFLFKGKGNVKLNPPIIDASVDPPKKVNVQWADKGSYRLKNMQNMIDLLPSQKKSIFMGDPNNVKHFRIYVLDNYAVHLQPEIKKLLLSRGYIPIFIGGGITGNIFFSKKGPVKTGQTRIFFLSFKK